MTLTREIHGEISAPLGDAMRAAQQAGEVTYLRWKGIEAAVIPAPVARQIEHGLSDTDTLRHAAAILRRSVIPGKRSWSRDMVTRILDRTADKMDAQ